MKKIFAVFGLWLALAVAGLGQASQNNFPIAVDTQTGAPSGNCPGPNVVDINISSGDFWDCPVGGGSWVKAGNASSSGGTVTSVSGAGIATGTVTTSGSITVAGSGNTTTAATAGLNLAGATTGNVVTADGSGNVQSGGTLLSALETTAAAQAAFSGIGSCTNQAVTGNNANGAPTCSTLSGSFFSNFGAHTFLGNNTGSGSTAAANLIGTSDTSPNWYAVDSGTVNAYVVALSPPMTALTTGVIGCFKTSNPNTTTTPTVNFNSLGAVTIKKANAIAVAAGDINSTQPSCVIYDGSAFEVINPQSNVGSGKNVYQNATTLTGVTTLTGLLVGSNTQRLTADSTGITATTPATGTAVFSWGALPTSTNFSFFCAGTYTQATAAGGVSIAVQGATNAPTKLDAWATLDSTNPASTTYTGTKAGTYGLATTTATLVAAVTPGAAATQYQWTLNGSIQVGASASNLNIIFFSGSSSDSVVIKEGSFCTLTP